MRELLTCRSAKTLACRGLRVGPSKLITPWCDYAAWKQKTKRNFLNLVTLWYTHAQVMVWGGVRLYSGLTPVGSRIWNSESTGLREVARDRVMDSSHSSASWVAWVRQGLSSLTESQESQLMMGQGRCKIHDDNPWYLQHWPNISSQPGRRSIYREHIVTIWLGCAVESSAGGLSGTRILCCSARKSERSRKFALFY